MASKFTITAELNLQTKNLNQVVNNLRQQFQGANLNIKIKDLAQAQAQLNKISSSAQSAQKSVGLLGSSFGQAFRRFTVVTAVTGTIVGFTRALKNAVGDAIEFEREVVKIAQATGKTTTQLKSLTNEISNVSSSFGVSSKELILAARSLTQAGFAADKVTGALKVLAQTELAATFDSIQDTTEGAIALLNQFGRQAQRTGSEVAFLEKSFSAINQVSKEFAVESSDLVTAIRTTGSAFESAGGSLDELLALFTSVRATTRESAESIATGFRTIFTRVQRVDTINNLKALGIQLQDAEGKFIGPIEATKRLSAALNSIDPRDFRFNLVVEELGGFRQVSKVIPLIQQFAVTQKALNVAQGSSGSLAKDAQTAQQSLAVQIAKTREEFSRFIRDLTGTESFQNTVRFLLDLANAFIKVADSIKPLVPLIAGFATFKAGTAVKGAFDQLGGARKKNQGGVIGFATGGLVPGSGNGDTVPAMLSPGEFVIRKSSVKKLGADNLARMNSGGYARYAEGTGGTGANKRDVAEVRKNIKGVEYTTEQKVREKGTKVPDSFTPFDIGAVFLRPSGIKGDSTGFIPIPKEYTIDNAKKSTILGDKFYNAFNNSTSADKRGVYYKLHTRSLSDSTSSQIEDKIVTKIVEAVDQSADIASGMLGTKADNSKLGRILKKANIDQVSGNIFEAVLLNLNAPFNEDDASSVSFDFKNGLGNVASLFSDANALVSNPTDARNSYTTESVAKIGPKIAGLVKEESDKIDKAARMSAASVKLPNLLNNNRLQLSELASLTGKSKPSMPEIESALADLGYELQPSSTKGKYSIAKKMATGGPVSGSLTDIPWMASGGSIPNAPLVDDILQASGAILPNPKTAISQIKQAGGAALDMDRTLLRTIGDLAYGKAKTPEEKLAVLKKYFFDDAARLKDVKTAKLTQFGMALQKAIKNKEIDPKNLSIISKSDRTPGLPEFLQSLFGISPANMVFTGGKNKQPALDIFREKGAFFASGGLANGTDTVPAMLTPGEFVINRKSAQRIGYGALNRMNKVGKYANGGIVQMFNNGTGSTGANPSSQRVFQTTSSGVTTVTNQAAINSQIKEQDFKNFIEKIKNSSDKLLILGATATSVAAHLGGLDEKTANLVSSFGATFATVKGIGGNLVEFGAGIKGIKPEILKGLNAGLTGFASAQAVAAARVTYLGQQAEDSGKKVDSFIEALSKGEGTTQGQLAEELTKQFQAASDAQARGSSGAKITGAIGGLAAGGIATALGAGAFAPVIAGTIAPVVEEVAYQFGAFSESSDKAKTQADALAAAMFSTTTSNRDFQKFFQSIDKQTPENVTKQAQSLAKAYGEQQAQIAKLGDLGNASETVKKRFEAVSEAAKLTANNLQTLIGMQLQNAVKKSSDLLNRGFVPDTNKLLEPVFASIRSDIEARYANQITQAGGPQTQKGMAIANIREKEISIEQERARKTLNEATKQQLEMIAVLNIENNVRKELIGSLQKQSAISASIERLSYELDLASKSVSNVDAAFSGSLTGLKSSFNPDILKLKSPDQDKLNKALDPVRAIGPIGKDLADNILNINEVMPNLEAKLIEFSNATDTASGALFDVKKFVEQSFNIKGDSIVGKTLIKLIEGTTTGTGGEKAVTAAKTSLRQEDVRKKIVESFQKFGEEFRTQAGGILDNLARAEQEGRAVAEKINESRQKQLELQLQSVDTFSNYIDALAKARGRDLTLLEKNTIRNMKQYALAGNMANNIGAISNELSGIYKQLNEGGLNLDQQKNLSFTATKLKAALEDLANQSGKTSDILAEIEKQRAKRESARDFGKEFTFGSNEQRQSIANSIQGLQRVLATGNINDIPEELRSGVSSLLDRFKDVPLFNGLTGRQVENKLIANQFRAMGGGAFANMIEADTSTPEQILIGELQRTFAVQIQAQQALAQIEAQKQDALQNALNEYTTAIGNYSAQLEKLVQEFQKKAEEKPMALDQKKVAQEKFLLSGPAAGMATSGMQIAPGGGLVSPKVTAFPTDAKKKIDLENIQAINEATSSFAANIQDSDAKIGELTLSLETLRNNFNKLNEIGFFKDLESQRKEQERKAKEQSFTPEQIKEEIMRKLEAEGGIRRAASGGLVYRAGGGSIFQPKGTDTVPAMLTPGEFVIKKSSVDKIGVDNLKALNNGYANGGLVSYLAGGGAAGTNALNDLVKRVAKLEEKVKELEKENKVLKGMLGQVGPINQMAGSVQNMQQTMGAMVAQPAAMSFGMQMPMSSRNQARERARQRSIEKTFEEEGFGTPKAQPVSTQVENLAMPNDMAAFQVNPMVSPVELKTAAQTKEEERAALGKKLIDQAKAAQTITPEMQKAKIDQLTAENKARVEKERAEIERNRVPSLDEIANMASSPIPTYERKPQQTPEQKAAQAADAKAKAMADIDAKYKKLQSEENVDSFLGIGSYDPTNSPTYQKNLQEITARRDAIRSHREAIADTSNITPMKVEDIIPQRTVPSAEEVKKKASEQFRLQQDLASSRALTVGAEVDKKQAAYDKEMGGFFGPNARQAALDSLEIGAKTGAIATAGYLGGIGIGAGIASMFPAAGGASAAGNIIPTVTQARHLGTFAAQLESATAGGVGSLTSSATGAAALESAGVAGAGTLVPTTTTALQSAAATSAAGNIVPTVTNAALPALEYAGSTGAVQSIGNAALPMARNLLALPGFAKGGSTDTVPAMLTPGEFVMNRDAVSKYGKSFMEKMNRGGIVPGFASGGYVGYYAGGGIAATMANRRSRGMNDGQMMTTAQAMQRSVMLRQNMMANQFANNPMVQQGVMANPMAQRPAQQASGGGNAVGAIGGGMADAAQQFSQFVTQFSDAAKMMTGMTMTHKVTIDGQINIGGIDGPSIAKAIKDDVSTYIKEQVESIMNKKNGNP